MILPRLRRALRWPVRIFAGFLLLLLLLWLLRFPLFGGLLEDTIAGALQGEGIRLEVADLSGSLLFDVEVRGVRVVSSEGVPAIREASVGEVRARYSPLDLLRGRDDWIREVRVSEVRGTIDLEAPPGPPRPESPPSEGGGPAIRPRHVALEGLDLTVLSGEDRLELRGARVEARSPAPARFDGSFGAALARAAVEGEEHAAHDAAGTFRFADGVLTVTRVGAAEGEIEDVLRADLSALDDGRVDARLRLPFFGGRIDVDAAADLSGDEPAGDAEVLLDGVRPRPLLRFLPGVPADLEEISGKVDVTLPAGEGELVERLDGGFTLDLGLPEYEGHSVRELHLAGTVRGAVVSADGTFREPDGELRARMDLRSEEILEATVRLPGLDLAVLGLTVEGRDVRGVAEIDAKAKGPLDAPAFEGDVRVANPSVGEYRADTVAVRASGTPDEIRFDLAVHRGADRVSADGRLALGDEVRFAGIASVAVGEIADYREILPPEVPADLAGRIDLEVTADGTPEAPGASVRLTGAGLRLEDLSIRKLRVAARVGTTERIEIGSLTARGAGELPDVTIEDALLELADGTATVTAGGLRISRGGLAVAAKGPLRVRSEEDVVAVEGALVFEDLDAAEIARQAGADLTLAGRLSGTIDLAGTVNRPRVDLRVEAGPLAVTPPGRPEIRTTGMALEVAVADGAASLRSLRLTGEGWSFAASGRVPFDVADPEAVARAPLEARLDLTSVPLGVAGPLPGLTRLEGAATAGFDLSGTVDALRASGGLEIGAAVLGFEDPALPRVAGVHLALEVSGFSPDGGVVRMRELTAKVCDAAVCGSGSVTVDGEALRDPRMRLDVTGVDLSRLERCFSLESPVRGEGTFSLDLEPGPRLRVVAAGRSLRFGDLPAHSFDLDAVAEGGTLRVVRAALTGPDSSLDVTGTVPVRFALDPPAFEPDDSRPADLRLVLAGLDLSLLGRAPGLALRDEGIAVGGKLGADLSLGGPESERFVRGDLRLEGVRFRAPDSPRLSEFGGTVRIDAVQRGGDDWTREVDIGLRKLAGKLAGGDLALSGTFSRRQARGADPTDRIEIAIDAQNALLARQEGLRFRSDLNLRFTGESPTGIANGSPALKLAGRIRVRGVRYTRNVDYLDRSPSLAPLPLTADPILGGVGLDLVLVAPKESIRIRNNVLDAEVGGRLEIGGTVAVPRPEGRLHVSRGKVHLPTLTMDLERAAIEFRRNHPLRPFIDARTTARISGFEVFADARGPADGLKIDLSSNPPLEKPDILSLIATGVPRSGLGAGSVGSAAATMLYRQVSSELSGNSDEDSTLSQLASRVELDVDTGPLKTGGTPAVRATIRLLGDWLFLRGSQEDALNYGLDLLFRLSFP